MIDELERRFPPARTNEAALRLEEKAALVGIALAPEKTSNRHRPAAAEKSVYDAARAAVSGFVTREATGENEEAGLLPEEVARFLSLRGEALAAVRDELLSSAQPPRWEMDLTKGAQYAPLPNLLGILNLQKLLLAAALSESLQGRAEEAERHLEASWRLNEALVARPELISQLIAIAGGKLQIGILRKLAFDREPWLERLPRQDFRAAFFWSLRAEATASLGGEGKQGSPELLEYARGMREVVRELEKENACSFRQEGAERFWQPLFPGREARVLSGITLPNLTDAVHRVFRFELDRELTALVLEARRALRSRQEGRRPDFQDRPSLVCPGARWNYRISGGGDALTIAFEGHLPEWETVALKLPLSFRFAAVAPRRP